MTVATITLRRRRRAIAMGACTTVAILGALVGAGALACYLDVIPRSWQNDQQITVPAFVISMIAGGFITCRARRSGTWEDAALSAACAAGLCAVPIVVASVMWTPNPAVACLGLPLVAVLVWLPIALVAVPLGALGATLAYLSD